MNKSALQEVEILLFQQTEFGSEFSEVWPSEGDYATYCGTVRDGFIYKNARYYANDFVMFNSNFEII